MADRDSTRMERALLVFSRVLLALIATLLAAIPWSECYCALDNFPNGQDFETNLLAFLALLALTLLLIELSHRGLSAFLALHHYISRLKLGRPPAQPSLVGFPAATAHRTRLPSHLSAACNLPLLI